MEESIEKLIRNVLSGYGLKFFTLALRILVVPVLITAVGDEGFGLLILSATILGYFSLLRSGIPGGTIKYVAEYEAKEEPRTVRRIINSSFTLYSCVGIIACVSISVFTYFGGLQVFNVSEDNAAAGRRLVYTAGIFSIIKWPGGILKQVLQGYKMHHRQNVISGATQALGLVAAIAAAKIGAGIVAIFLAQRSVKALEWALYYRHIKNRLPRWIPNPFTFDLEILKKIFSYSGWMLLSGIAALLVYQTDRIIVSAALSVSMLTVYKVVTQPYKGMQSIHRVLITVAMPHVSSLDTKMSAGERNEFAYRGARYSNMLLGCLTVGAALYVQPFIRLWVGERFVEYAWIAQSLCLGSIFMLSNGFLNAVFKGTGRVKRLALLAVFMSVLNLTLSIWWVHTPMGVGGVVIATVVATSCSAGLQYFILFPLLELKKGRYLLQSVLAPVAPAVLIGGCALPFWSFIANIDSWSSLAGSIALTGLPMIVINWFVVVKKEDRSKVVRHIRAQMR